MSEKKKALKSKGKRKNKKKGEDRASKTSVPPSATTSQEVPDDLACEDPFEDEFFSEPEEAEAEMEVDDKPKQKKKEKKKKKTKKKETEVFQPGVDKLGPDEKLDYDATAYSAYYQFRGAEWPCLTFDILKDSLGDRRTKFPQTLYLATGTQADSGTKNKIHLLKISDVHRTENDEDSDDDDPNTLDDDPILEDKNFPHPGGVNRLRSMPQFPYILASWSDQKQVLLWNTEKLLKALDKPPTERLPPILPPLFTFKGHTDEGFALDWSPTVAGNLLSGGNDKKIYLWETKDHGASWIINPTPFTDHGDAVEDLQWSPIEATVFASCSVDRTIRIWDSRVRTRSQLSVIAHSSDVNVISWNRLASHLFASGGDDGHVKVWDLRNFKADQVAADYNYHTRAITSVQWHPTDEAVLVAASDDDTISVWDMSLEADTDAMDTEKSSQEKTKTKEKEKEKKEKSKDAAPEQLLFLHAGQKSIKEVHFHPQIPSLLISTALDGFNLWKPANM